MGKLCTLPLLTEAGFTMAGADHAIIPIMLGDAKVAAEFAERAFAKGIYVIGFFLLYQRVKLVFTKCLRHISPEQLDKAIDAFIEVEKRWVSSN